MKLILIILTILLAILMGMHFSIGNWDYGLLLLPIIINNIIILKNNFEN
jgi:hypothetical protein